jgi:hypothetical protein
MGWSEKYKKSINCNNPKGFSQKAHCASKKKNEDMVFEEITEDILNEKLITYGNRKPYGQIVFIAGGAGSGKGFAIKNFLDSASFKIRDVDEMKKQLQILNRLGKLDIRSILKKYGRNIKLKDLDLIRKIEKDGYKLQNLNLKNPDHVYALHILVKAMGIKDSSLEKLLLGKNNPETLPNILFDITAKDVTDITNVIPKLKEVGYKPENIHLTWILTNYVTSLVNNKNRSRMVPDGSMGSENIMLKTHEGAANTIWGLVTKALPKGMNGRVDVILNNPENTVFVKGVDGKDLEKTQKDNKGNDVKVKFTSGFLSLPLKKEKGGIFSEKVWKNKLFNWVKDNAPDSITANMKEATFRPNSGTMSGGTYGLDKRKYELNRDVKGVQIGDYTNVTLPKGTIIYNLPGGVFAHHRSLKSYEAGMNKYFNKPTFRGISIRREKNVILSIEKNSKILESVNEVELKLGVKYVNKKGKEGFIQTGGSKNSQDWFWFDGKVKHPYDKVKKELKPSKDQKKTGFSDYLKQGGRVWDNVNKDGESVNEGPMDRIFGGIPYTKKGNQSIVTMKLPDDVKKRIIQRAKKEGKVAKPNNGGGVTVFESVNEADRGDMGYVEKHKSIATIYDIMDGGKKVRVKLGKTGKLVVIDTKDIQIMPEGIDEAVNEATLSQIHKAAKKGSYPVSIVATMLGKVVKQELVKTPMAVPAAFMGMQGAYPKAKISVESRTGQILFQEMSINEYLSPSDVDSAMKEFGIKKIPISSQGERILKGMQKEGFIKKVTNKERLIYFYESLGKEKFGYGVKEKPLSPLVNRYSNDISSEAIFFGGKMAAWNVVTNIKDRLANREEVDSTYYMLKDYFDSFGMDTNRSRVFKSATFQVDEWLKRNKKIAQQIGENTMVNEISAINGLKQVVKGNTKEVEGIKVSKEMAQAMIDWFNSSPYGRKYPKAAKARLHLSLGIMMSFGLDRYAKHKGAKEELKYIKDLSKAMRDNVNESTFAGWIAGYNGKQIEIKKGEAKDLYNAKLLAIKKLKVPKSKVGLMFIKPAVDESVVNEAKYKVGDNVTVTLKGGNKVYKGKVEKINPLRIRTSPSDVTVLGNHMIQSVVNEAKPKLNANQIMEKLAKESKSFKDFVKAMYNESSFRNSKYWRFRKDKAILDWFQKVYNSVNESVNEAKNDNLYVVIDFHEKGGGFVMTKPSSKKLADDSARSITKTRDITKREVVKVKDARKIRGLAGKQYLKEESVNESVASLIDQIRQDSKDVKDFVKNIFKDSEFKKMSNDKDFIKYLKSVYEGINENDNVITLEERVNLFFEENIPTNPSKWSYYKSQAKEKFDVYPSAYANGWAAKQYKAAGGGWKKKK